MFNNIYYQQQQMMQVRSWTCNQTESIK